MPKHAYFPIKTDWQNRIYFTGFYSISDNRIGLKLCRTINNICNYKIGKKIKLSHELMIEYCVSLFFNKKRRFKNRLSIIYFA